MHDFCVEIICVCICICSMQYLCIVVGKLLTVISTSDQNLLSVYFVNGKRITTVKFCQGFST